MSTPTDRSPRRDPDGIRVSTNPRVRRTVGVWVAGAVLLMASMAAYLVVRGGGPSTSAQPAAGPTDAPLQVTAPRPVKVVAQAQPKPPASDGERPRSEPPAPREAPVPREPSLPDDVTAPTTAEEKGMIAALIRDVTEGVRMNGGNEGIGVYPPKGTNPPKPGIIVPEDFKLPEGYVRYHQVTDDGQRLPPILMFSPDYDFVDADGKPIVLPESGIVPPEMAPAGLPTRMLEIPDQSGARAR